MKAGLSTIQQTLTPEAATILNQSIAEAKQRNHSQTTPLHVAATLLADPSGYLRQACIRSHSPSSHPLPCRSLEVCFSVALDRLPTAAAQVAEPPVSNALMAALKRAQAHQRRGCPEQQQQPLLAVKVELEQLIISILDDPSVSRVMREAKFSSPAVKATIENSLSLNNPVVSGNGGNVNLGGIVPRMVTSPARSCRPESLDLSKSLSSGNSIVPVNGGIVSRPVSPARLSTQPSLNLSNASVPGGNVNLGGIVPRMVNSPAWLSTPDRPVMNSPAPVVPLANRNVYMNPRLQQKGASQVGNQPRSDEVKRVLEILMRAKKRNPVLVGDSEPENVVKEVLRKIENKEFGSEGCLKNVQVIPIGKEFLSDKNLIGEKIKRLGDLVQARINGSGVILDMGDLKWLVTGFGGLQQHQQNQAVVSEMGRVAVVEMAKLLARFSEDETNGNNKLWLIGTATCETYLRCQVYHSTMENDWDLQAVPITPKSPLPGMFPRLGTNGKLNNNGGSLSLLKSVPKPPSTLTKHVSENLNPTEKTSFCTQCSDKYEKELAKLIAIEKSFSEDKPGGNAQSLPQWLQNAKLTDPSKGNDQDLLSKQKTQQLQKKWRDTCLHLHPDYHKKIHSERTLPSPISITSLCRPNLLARPPFQPRLQTTKPLGEALQLNMNQPVHSPPTSPVRTDLVLGRKDAESITTENPVKDFLGCISSEPQTKLLDKFANKLDADMYKKLLKGLMEKAWWQAEAASAVASAITRCGLGDGKRRGAGSRGDIWLLFSGPDRIGKKKMALVLAEQVCGTSPVTICLGKRRDDEDQETNFRGKTAIDRISEAVKRNPFSVIMLQDIDEADILVRGSIKRAMEKGRLLDAHGREISLGNAVFVLTGDWSTTSLMRDGHFLDEKRLASIASGNWQLGLIVREKSSKRQANWLQGNDRTTRPRKDLGLGLSLDLNLAADMEEERSYNSSDLTIDHEHELCLVNKHFSVTSVPHDLINNVDDLILFKPVDPVFVRREIKKTILVKFSMVVDENMSIEVEDDVLEKILGGLWHDRTSLEEWIENVLAPSFDELKSKLPSGETSNRVVRLVVDSSSGNRVGGDWLPDRISVQG